MRDKELQAYYENQWGLFAQPGWKDLMEDLQKLKDSVNNLSVVSDAHDLYFRKGQIDILDLLLKRKEACEKVFEELSNDSSL